MEDINGRISTLIRITLLYCRRGGWHILPAEVLHTLLKRSDRARTGNVKHKVSSIRTFLDETLILYLKNGVVTFSAGQISQYIDNWRKIRSDPYILNIVSSDTIEFVSHPAIQQNYPPNSSSRDLLLAIESELKDLLSKGVVTPVEHEDLEFVSPILCVPKKDDKVRIFLNLKN